MDAFASRPLSAEKALNVSGAVVHMYGNEHATTCTGGGGEDTAVTHRPCTGGIERTPNGTERRRAIRRPSRPMPGGRRHDDLGAAEILSVTHMVALLLILLSAVLFKHSIGDPESTTPWLFLGQGVVLVFIGNRLGRNKLVILARRRGLSEADAKAYAKGQMLQLTEPWRQSKTEIQTQGVVDTARVRTLGSSGEGSQRPGRVL